MAFAKVGNGLWTYKEKLKSRFNNPNRRQRTYIVPTFFGLIFGSTAMLLFIMALGYANNLLYMIVFFISAVCLMSMYRTNKNVDSVRIHRVAGDWIFAEKDQVMQVFLKNTKPEHIYDIELYINQGVNGSCQVPPSIEISTPVLWTPARRGWQKIPVLTMQSQFPFGLLRAWKVFRGKQDYLVFPARRGRTEYPVLAGNDDKASELGLFREHAKYQLTDSVKRIDWRKSAKARLLLIKKMEGDRNLGIDFNWDQTVFHSSFEDRVSQLALWVDRAYEQGLEFSLHVGLMSLPRSTGIPHYRQAMESLALLEEGEGYETD